MTRFPLKDYLKRIRVDAEGAPTSVMLECLHRAQSYAIPFENFDVVLGRSIDIRPAALSEKLIYTARGGYCFELNGLFFSALHALGFDARFVLARVHISGSVSPRAHVAIIVRVDGAEWLADVGFGGPGLRAPIPFVLNQPVEQDGENFRLVAAAPYGTMLQTREAGEWRNNYSFDLEHVCEADLEMGNHFAATHPESIFTRARIANILTPNGRISLMNYALNRVTGAERAHETLQPGAPYLQALKRNFGIELGVDFDALPELNDPTTP